MATQNHRPRNEGILILDYGSQYTMLIARRLRECGVYCEIIDGCKQEPLNHFKVVGFILSGGPDSVAEVTARQIPHWVLEANRPILGICYGMQLLIERFGGQVRSGTKREYGKSFLRLKLPSDLIASKMFSAIPDDQQVWMSHGDDVEQMPRCFDIIGKTPDDVVAAIGHQELPLIGLQFHPEVQHTVYGKQLLKQFVTDICQFQPNWRTENMLHATMDYLKRSVGNGHVLMAVSGGVDSTVATTLMVKALAVKQVTAVFMDTGLLRKFETDEVIKQLHRIGLKDLVVLDRQQVFFNGLKDVIEPEQKRKLIGNTFIKEFEGFAKAHKTEFTHLGQGTLYPDVIESAGHGAGAKVIKSHHNVGGLPEKLHLKLVEPFRFLFKDEVRLIGEELGLPHEIVYRHPFPGPGLAIRILGEVTREKVALLQEADHIFIDNLKKYGFYDDVWQAACVLLPIKTVGVMGDNRTYQSAIALRAVTSSDGMTADVNDLPMTFLTKVADEIVRKVHGINRVVYDITSKPPATIEWE